MLCAVSHIHMCSLFTQSQWFLINEYVSSNSNTYINSNSN